MPTSSKYFFTLASLILTGYVLVIAAPLFNPLFAALILAFILKPLCSRMERWKIPRTLSTLLAMLLIVMIIGAFSLFFSSQIATITFDVNALDQRLNILIDKLQNWGQAQFGVEPQQQIVYLKSSLSSLLKNSTVFFRHTLSATAGFFTAFFLFLLALFFFLNYRTFITTFLYQLFAKTHHTRLGIVLGKVEGVIRSYILGLFFVVLTIAILNTTGLFFLGIQHALFFGVLAAVLTIIPYIGIIIGSSFPILFALLTKDSLWYPLGVLILFMSVQFLEGNFITPNIVGNQVSINAFAAILGLFIGGMLLGITGVIFAIPVLAIIKVICDSVDRLKPFGFIIGNPPNH